MIGALGITVPPRKGQGWGRDRGSGAQETDGRQRNWEPELKKKRGPFSRRKSERGLTVSRETRRREGGWGQESFFGKGVCSGGEKLKTEGEVGRGSAQLCMGGKGVAEL